VVTYSRKEGERLSPGKFKPRIGGARRAAARFASIRVSPPPTQAGQHFIGRPQLVESLIQDRRSHDTHVLVWIISTPEQRSNQDGLTKTYQPNKEAKQGYKEAWWL